MPQTYTVKKGENLNSIAQQHGFSNYKDAGITGFSSGNPDLIYPGEQLALEAVQQTKPIQEVGAVTSNQGLKELRKAQDAEARLSPLEFDNREQFNKVNEAINKANQEGADLKPISEDYVTFADTDGREVTLKGDALTPEKQQDLQNRGYTEIESKRSEAEETPQMKEYRIQAEKATQEEEDLRSKVMSYLISDADLQNELNAISTAFDVQQQEMQRINENRQEAIRTMGVRMGSRYTGGTGGVIGSIIAEEQRQGIAHIAELEAQKQAALAGAKREARNFNLALYTQEINRAEEIQDQKVKAVQDLMEKQEKANKEMNELYEQERMEIGTLNLINEGIEDPLAILTELKRQGISATPKKVEEFTNLIANQEDLAGLSTDFRTYEFLKESRPEELKAMGVNTYKDYLRATGDAKRAVKASGGGSGDIIMDGVVIPEDSRVWEVIDEFTHLDELTSSERQKVKSELFALGAGSDTPPDWFVKQFGEGAGVNQIAIQGVETIDIKDEWKKFKQRIGLTDEDGDEDVDETTEGGFTF